jgi:hypothetical protein
MRGMHRPGAPARERSPGSTLRWGFLFTRRVPSPTTNSDGVALIGMSRGVYSYNRHVGFTRQKRKSLGDHGMSVLCH